MKFKKPIFITKFNTGELQDNIIIYYKHRRLVIHGMYSNADRVAKIIKDNGITIIENKKGK